MKNYIVNGEKMTAKEWKNLHINEMNHILKHQEFDTAKAIDKNGKEYSINWQPIICEM